MKLLPVDSPAQSDDRLDARGLDRTGLDGLVVELGLPPFRAAQLFRWIHRRGATSFEEMTDLPVGLREALARRFFLRPLALDLVQESSDGTLKYRLKTWDGRFLETVFMPETKRRTLCVSSQVGCAMGCAFCRTATMGLVRQLTTGEIVGQVYAVEADLRRRGWVRPPWSAL